MIASRVALFPRAQWGWWVRFVGRGDGTTHRHGGAEEREGGGWGIGEPRSGCARPHGPRAKARRGREAVGREAVGSFGNSCSAPEDTVNTEGEMGSFRNFEDAAPGTRMARALRAVGSFRYATNGTNDGVRGCCARWARRKEFFARDVVLRKGLAGLGLRRGWGRKVIKNPVQTGSFSGHIRVGSGPAVVRERGSGVVLGARFSGERLRRESER